MTLTQLLSLQFLLLCLLHLITGQSLGNGISKHTWAVGDPRTCYDWFFEFLPVTEEAASCDDGICDCATQGRVKLAGYTGKPNDGKEKELSGFALHTVNCSYHPHGELSLYDMEGIFQEKFGDFSVFDGFMDFNLGLWTNDLDVYIRKFLDSDVQFLTLHWIDEELRDFYSVLVNPCGYVVLELISDKMTEDVVMVSSNPRMIWSQWNDEFLAIGEYLTPIKVSRAVSNVDKVASFYMDIINSTEVYEKTFADDVKVKIINAPGSTVHLQFWEGVTTGGNGWTAEDLEIYLNNVHDEIMVSPTCGFDQWIDNHIAIDALIPTLDEVIPKLKETEVPYHIWGGSTGGGFDKLITVYAADPFGWGIQLDLPYYSPPPSSDLPFYSTYCESNDGCEGQGFCDLVL